MTFVDRVILHRVDRTLHFWRIARLNELVKTLDEGGRRRSGRDLISQKVFMQSSCESRFPHKSVNLLILDISDNAG